MVAEGGLNSYYNPQCIQLDKERFFKEKRQVLCIQKDMRHFLSKGCNPIWVQFHAYQDASVKLKQNILRLELARRANAPVILLSPLI